PLLAHRLCPSLPREQPEWRQGDTQVATPQGDPPRAWHGWCSWQGCRERVRRGAATLDPAAARQARHRQRRTAQKAGRRLTAPTRAVAGWRLLINPLEAVAGSTADAVALSRARWLGGRRRI